MLRVLLTEDSPADAELELRELKRAGLAVVHRTVDAEDAFIGALREFLPDVILSDFSMPGFDGMAALALARELSPETPFIFVSGTIGEEYAIRALRNGATDYVLKSNLVRLPAAVERAVAEARARRERQRTDAEQRVRIERLSRIRELLGALSFSLVRARDRGAVFDEFCRIALERGGFALARIVELDAQGRARVAATTEADAAPFQALLDDYNRDPARAGSLLAEALRTGRPMISNDVAADERVQNRAALTRGGNYALAQLPVSVEERIAAVVTLRAREPGFFDQEELRLLAEMVSNISFALELIAKQDRIAYLALYDTLTGLPNRTLLRERLQQAIDAPRDAARKMGLVLLDIERFRSVNDALGTAAGDRLLMTVAARVAEFAGERGRAARVAGDQFAILMPAVRHARDVGRLVESMVPRLLDTVLELDGRELRVAVKAGAALYPDDGDSADALIHNAEAALGKAKQTGDRFLFYTPLLNARVAERLDLEARLRRAVERGEFVLHHQPKVELASRRITGVEALLRWHGDAGGTVPPAQFVPVLEDTGLIGRVGAWVMQEAVKTHRAWSRGGRAAPRIAVNVSALQLRARTFVDEVRAALGGAGAGAGLDLEITESLLMEDFDASLQKLRAVRDLGVHIALDDFGTGYSSLAYLGRLPIDTVKIDRSFVRNMVSKTEDASIVSAILSLARALRLRVVAEGVETEEQARLLQDLHCDEMQGYLFSPPVAAQELEALLRG